MANEISYGLKFNTQDMERLIKLAEKLDKTMKSAQKSLTEQAKIEGKKQIEQFKHDKKIELEVFKNINKQKLADEKAVLKSLANERKKLQNGKFDMFAPANMAKRVAEYIALSTVIYGSLKAFRAGTAAIVEFEKQIGSLRSALEDTTKYDVELMKQFAHSEHLVYNYGISAKSAAEGMTILAKAGLNANETLKALEPSLALAAAGQISLSEASETLVKITAGAGLGIESAGQIADYLAKIDVESITNIQELGDALKVAAPAGKAFGQSIESTISILGAMSKAGLKGTQAGNAYARVMLRMTKDQKEVAAGLKKYGIDIFDKTTGKIRDMGDVFKDIEKSGVLKNVADGQRIFGLYAYKSATQIASTVTEIDKLKESLKGAEGAAKEMASIKLDTLSGEIDKLKAHWENLFTGKEGIALTLKDATFLLNEFIVTLNSLLNIDGGSLFSPAVNAIKEANKELLKFQKNAGFIQDPTLRSDKISGREKTAERGRIREYLSSLTPEQLKEKKETYLANIRTRERWLKDAQALVKIDEERSILNPIPATTELGRKIVDARRYIKQNSDLLDKFKFYAAQTDIELMKKMYDDKPTKKEKDTTTTIGGTGGKSSKTKKKEFDDLEAWLRSLLQLRNKYAEKELTGYEKIQQEIINTYDEKELELNQKYIHNVDKYIQLEQLKADKANALLHAKYKNQKDMEDQALKDVEERAEKEAEKSIKAYEDRKQMLAEYGNIEDRLSALQEEMQSKLDIVQGNEEAIYNLKQEYADKAIEMYREDWEKRNKITNAALGSMEAGYGAFTQAMSDDLQVSKAESEAVWEAIKQTFISKIMEMAWAAALSGIFSFFMPGGGFLSGLGNLLNGAGDALSGGFNLSDAVVSGGKVYPYRKDDLVMIGTGLGSKSGAQLPDKALPQGNNSNGGNVALINELRSLRLAVARSDANNVKAIADNTPVFQGTVMDDVSIYKKSLTGKKKANFIVANDK